MENENILLKNTGEIIEASTFDDSNLDNSSQSILSTSESEEE
tara:strand:+ start:242 stop:367 length:126 start_codon:yes stop_codon:yes gene_type:complete